MSACNVPREHRGKHNPRDCVIEGVKAGSSSPVTMTPSEAETFVLELLRTRGPMTTAEIDRSAAEESRKCPDQTVLFLTKMKRKGLIKGEVSQEKRGWLWDLP